MKRPPQGTEPALRSWWRRLWERAPARLGRWGERAAARHLQAQGYTILARNYRVPGGEADLVARRDGILVVVEVKARSGGGQGQALEAITSEKGRRVWRAAVAYCRAYGISVSCLRVDAMAVVREGREVRITHVPGAIRDPRGGN